MGRIEVPDAEGLPRTRFESYIAVRRRLSTDWDGWRADAERRAGDPEKLSRLLGKLDMAARHHDETVERLRAVSQTRSSIADTCRSAAEAEAYRKSAKRTTGVAEAYAAHARNLRRLRNAVCKTMMEALR